MKAAGRFRIPNLVNSSSCVLPGLHLRYANFGVDWPYWDGIESGKGPPAVVKGPLFLLCHA